MRAVFAIAALGWLAGCGLVLGADFDKTLADPQPKGSSVTENDDPVVADPCGSGGCSDASAVDAATQGCPEGSFACDAGCCATVAVAVGDHHSCVVDGTGTVTCAGSDARGQIGDGRGVRDAGALSSVVGLAPVGSIAAGGDTTCAVDRAGVAKCWGDNTNGALGARSSAPASDAPVAVVGSGYASVAVGTHHACAVTTAATARCWGSNEFLKLGAGLTSAEERAPVDVADLTQVTAVAAGDAHSCAIYDGKIACWGANDVGQLGDGTSDPIARAYAQKVVGLGARAVAIAAGDEHTCALLSNGAVWCWGADGAGQLGNGAISSARFSTPAAVTALANDAVAIGAGANTTCAALRTGAVHCWGKGDEGQLGPATSTSTATPVVALGPGPRVLGLAVGRHHVCVATVAGARCWGRKDEGQLGVAR